MSNEPSGHVDFRDGRELRRTIDRCEMADPEDEECTWQGEELYGYYICSTVLGGEVISEGSAGKRPVIVGGEVIAYLTH